MGFGEMGHNPCFGTIRWQSFRVITSPAGAVAKYCNEHVCMCVCVSLSVRQHISRTTRAICTNFCACCLSPWLGLVRPAGWRNSKWKGQF